jgi:hypothetical protein
MKLDDLSLAIGSMNSKLDVVIATQNKTIYSLIGLIAAVIGVRLVGSPPMVVILAFVNFFVFTFMGLAAFYKRKAFKERYFLVVFALLGMTASIVSAVFYHGAATEITRGLFILGNISLLIYIWRHL